MAKSNLKLVFSNTQPKKLFGYRTYNFVDKDPVIDAMRTAIIYKRITHNELSVKSGVSLNTIRNWFYGETRKPQFATIQAVAKAMGYSYKLVKTGSTVKVKI
jgi:hypothetical protein